MQIGVAALQYSSATATVPSHDVSALFGSGNDFIVKPPPENGAHKEPTLAAKVPPRPGARAGGSGGLWGVVDVNTCPGEMAGGRGVCRNMQPQVGSRLRAAGCRLGASGTCWHVLVGHVPVACGLRWACTTSGA